MNRKGLLNNTACQVLGWNEFHVEGSGLVPEVFEAACGAGGGGLEGLHLVVGFPGGDEGPDDPGGIEFARDANPAQTDAGAAGCT